VLIGLTLFVRRNKRETNRKLEVQAKIETARRQEREHVRRKSSRDFHDELGNRLTKMSLLIGILQSKKKSMEEVNILERLSTNTQLLSGGLRDFIWMLDMDKRSLHYRTYLIG
jgi:signal transduction histidine kinase